MFEAYRQVKINPKFYKYLGFTWGERIYRYTCLPFGMASAPKIYTEFAEVIKQIALGAYPEIFTSNGRPLMDNYLDDFWSVHTDLQSAWEQFISFLEILTKLEVPTQWKKVIPPTKFPKILGFIFNIKLRCFHIPMDKIKQMTDRIDSILNKNSTTKRSIASIKGQLNWAGQVFYPSKAFLREFDLITLRKCGWDKKIRINKQAKEDLKFWKKLLNSSFNKISFDFYLKNRSDGDIHIWTDAAISEGTGIGGYASNGTYFQVSWDNIKTNWPWPENDISGPELLAVIVFTTSIAYLCKNKSIMIHCDNFAVVSMIIHEKCNYRKPSHMALIRYFISTMFENRIKFYINHIPGIHNTEADKLSRFKSEPFSRLYTDPHPTDQHTLPFFNINPKFPNNFKFEFMDLTKHTIKCLQFASE